MLLEVVSLMKNLQHNKIYKKLTVILLTVPVMSASCEHSHSKVVFVYDRA